jgi:hypothetical protein
MTHDCASFADRITVAPRARRPHRRHRPRRLRRSLVLSIVRFVIWLRAWFRRRL